MKNRIKAAYRKLDKVDMLSIGIMVGSSLVLAGHMYDMRQLRIADIRLIHDVEQNVDFINIVYTGGREANYLMNIDLNAR